MASPITFSGLSSGIDTDAIVKALMDVERAPAKRLQATLDAGAARQAVLGSIGTALGGVQTAARALRDPSLFAGKPSAVSSDAGRLTATATAGAVAARYDVAVTQTARAHVVTQSSGLAAATGADVLHLTAGGATVDVAVGAGDSLAVLRDRINGSGAGATASLVDGRLRLTAKATGTAAAISVTSDGSLAGDLGLATTLAARDAQFTVDGTAYTRGSNTVDDAIAGVTLNLKAATGAAGPVSLDVDPSRVDADAVVGAVRGLVTSYNAAVDLVRGKLSEKPVANASTAADAAKGAFFGDGLLSRIADRLHDAVADPVRGAAASADQASEAGLSFGALTGAVSADALSGRLALDETRLRSALAADPSAVADLFGGADGLATRLDALVTGQAGTGGGLALRQEAERTRAGDVQRTLDDTNARLDTRETTLRAQFTAMERSLSQLSTMQAGLGALGTGLRAA